MTGAPVPHPIDDLTPRQRDVLAMIVAGRTNPQIATALGVTIDGAKWHVREILSKLGVSTREDAAAMYRDYAGVPSRLARLAAGLAVPSGWKLVVAGGAAVLAVAAVVLIALAVAGGGEGPGDPAVPLPTSTAGVPSPTPPAGSLTPTIPASPGEPWYPPGTTTGIPEVDRVVGIMEAGDWAALEALFVRFPEPCAADPQGVGSPPRCPDGVPDGGEIETFRWIGCERGYPGDEASVIGGRVAVGSRLFAVFESPATARFNVLPAGDYSIVFVTPTGERGMLFDVTAEGVVGIWLSCGGDAYALLDPAPAGGFILPPRVPAPTPTPTPAPAADGYPDHWQTGIGEVDIAIDAVRSGIALRIAAHLRNTDGTVPATLPVFDCGLVLVPGAALDALAARLANADLRLFAVYATAAAAPDPERMPVAAPYTAVLNDVASAKGLRLAIDSGYVVGVDFGCGETAAELVEPPVPGVFILPPP